MSATTTRSRLTTWIALVLLPLGMSTAAHAVQVTATWTGAGNGVSWSDPANWSTANYPNNGTPAGTTYRVVIDGAGIRASSVTLNVSVTIDALVVDAGDALGVNNGLDLIIVNTGAGTGAITNNGTITLNSTGSSTDLIVNGNVTLAGSGTVTFGNNVNNRIFGVAAANRLTNGASHTIRGAGQIGVNVMALTNQGLIFANQTTTLTIDPSASGVVNSGTLRGGGGGILRLQDAEIANTGGTVDALSGSAVDLTGTTIIGGTLTTDGTGVVRNVGVATLRSLTNAGSFAGNNGTDTNLVGTITNTGDIALNSAGTSTDLIINGDVTLAGSGAVTFGNNVNNRIFGTADIDRLTNASGHTIRGSGQIGAGFMALTNQGTILANQSNTLTVDPSASGAVNAGTLRAAGGTLRLQDGAFANTGGTVEAQTASEVELFGVTVTGGTLASAGTGLVRNVGSGLNAATLSGLTNAGKFEANNGTDTNLVGTITNTGDIALNSAGTSTDLIVNGNVTLAGSGAVTFGNNINNRIFGVAATNRLTNGAGHTIQGAGQIGANFMALTNQGTILANQTTTLSIDVTTANDFTTSGTVQVDATRTLALGAGDNLVQTGGVTLVNGTLTGGTVNVQGGTLAGFGTVGANVVNAGTVSPGVLTGILAVNGTYTQTAAGTLRVEIGGTTAGTLYDRLAVSGAATLAGTVQVVRLGAYGPPAGATFQVLTYASRTGTMALSVDNTDGRGGFTQTYGATVLTLTAVGPTGVATLDGADGWRMLAAPSTTETVGGLLSTVWTQGFPGSGYPPAPVPNVYRYDEAVAGDFTAGYVAAGNATDAVPAGTGLFVYVYADDDPGTPVVDGGFPKVLTATGTPAAAPFAFPLSYTDTPAPPADDGWNLAGNPFAAGLDLDAPGLTRTNVSTAAYVWDPAQNRYLTRTVGVGDLGRVLGSFQGFWTQTTGPSPAFVAPAAAVVGDGPLAGREAPPLEIALRVQAADSLGAFDTAHVAFVEGAAVGLDIFDAYELAGLGAEALHLFAVVEDEGAARGLDVSVVPVDGADVVLGVSAPTATALVMTWPTLTVPEPWTLTLVDTDSGTEVDLRMATSYAFTAAGTASPGQAAGPPASGLLRVVRAAGAQGGPARFRLRAGMKMATATETSGERAELALEAPRPNPSRGASVVPFSLAEAGAARLVVVDLLGREVAVLVDGEQAAGRHTATVDVRSLAPGVYVVRLVAGAEALTRRLVVVR